MKKNDWKERLGMVYSTNKEFDYEYEGDTEVETLPKQQQRLRVNIEKNGRGGKTVTLVKGFVGRDEDLKELSKMLKVKCGVGGSAKDGEIVVQGDFKTKVIELLRASGYSDTK
ncbi:MAG: translation initiation factor [Bacteroides sp.]|nr:translation initiation factor [Roseburia sp.]MCM1345756.1 translation initiation factor [Bacteroides sp.]MCM1420149.1 translation initiation factor [Bacteroides sp.]